MPTRANRDTNSYGMKVDNGARAPHTEIEDRLCQNIYDALYTEHHLGKASQTTLLQIYSYYKT